MSFDVQVESIGFFNFNRDYSLYRRVVLTSIGIEDSSPLRKLKFYECKDVDPVAELLPHVRLECVIFKICSFIPIANATEFAERVPEAVLADCSNRFLPKLKKLEYLNTCLGQWSRLFECHRPALTELSLTCSHIGLPFVSQFNWNDATSYLWPNLRHLSLRHYDSFTLLKLLKSIVPHLGGFQHLKKFILPTTLIIPIGHGRVVNIFTMDALAQMGHPLPIGLRVRRPTLGSSYCPYTEEDQDQFLQ